MDEPEDTMLCEMSRSQWDSCDSTHVRGLKQPNSQRQKVDPQPQGAGVRAGRARSRQLAESRSGKTKKFWGRTVVVVCTLV